VADADIEAGRGADGPGSRKEPLISAEALAGITRALGWLLVIAGAGLAATGVPLIFVYRPDDPVTGDRSDVWWLRGAHSVTSTMFIGAIAGMVAVLAVASVRRLRVPPGWVVGLGGLAVAIVGLISGQLIAWDRLAMTSVTASDSRGVVDALSADVRSVVVDGTRVSRGAYAAWASVHLLAVPVVALGLAWLARHRTRHRRPPVAPAGEPAPDSSGPREASAPEPESGMFG
jgi:hypothetical protein